MRTATFVPAVLNGRFRLLAMVFAVVLIAAACGESASIVEPGPGTDAETSDPEDDPVDGEPDGDVVTGDETESDPAEELADNAVGDGAANGEDPSEGASGESNDDGAGTIGDGVAEDGEAEFVIDQDSENAAAYTELAVSGLVLTLDEQACADDRVVGETTSGADPVDAIAVAVQECASAATVDDFSSGLLSAGGVPLPPTEAACVSSRLQATEEYRPFWRALLDDEPFDFLLADVEVQDRYLELYSECVSVGRAIGEQANIALSAPTRGCIDALYEDREFVRVTIEADLSGDAEGQARIDQQLAGCLSADELALLGQ